MCDKCAIIRPYSELESTNSCTLINENKKVAINLGKIALVFVQIICIALSLFIISISAVHIIQNRYVKKEVKVSDMKRLEDVQHIASLEPNYALNNIPTVLNSDGKVISCYYSPPDQVNTLSQLLPSDIHPFLCTHINIGFAEILDKKVHINKKLYQTIKDLLKLKLKNPGLRIILSIGGSGNDIGFSEMVLNHANRKVFIRSVKEVLYNTSLDGIDLDWEFPGLHNDNKVGKRERQHFSQLLREIRKEYIREKRPYLLTVAAAAPEAVVEIAYDVDQLNLYVDYVNLMTYDFHFFSKYTPFTGFNSPLFARQSENWYLATLNVNYTVQMYIDKGLDRNKIVVGIPTYGHSYKLVNANNNGLTSPASGFGSLGSLGFVDFPEICKFLNENKFDVTIKSDADAKVSYLYRKDEWVSYDTPGSVLAKAKYIRENKLGGAMIYSLNADDYNGVCEGQFAKSVRFPLSQSVRNALYDESDSKFNAN